MRVLAFHSHVESVCMTASFDKEGREVWANKTGLTPSLFIEVPVPSQ